MGTIAKFTRKQVLNNECTHREYYGQFVTNGMKSTVLRYFTKDQLTQALQEDEHLNSIPLKKWDMIGSTFLSGGYYLSDKFKEVGDWVTQSCLVCIAKESARQIIESEN